MLSMNSKIVACLTEYSGGKKKKKKLFSSCDINLSINSCVTKEVLAPENFVCIFVNFCNSHINFVISVRLSADKI
jgi:hypothetical protein